MSKEYVKVDSDTIEIVVKQVVKISEKETAKEQLKAEKEAIKLELKSLYDDKGKELPADVLAAVETFNQPIHEMIQSYDTSIADAQKEIDMLKGV